MTPKYIIFDGDCSFCNTFVLFFAKKDRHKKFIFVSSLSKLATTLLNQNEIKGLELETVILFENDHIYSTKSKAIQKILLTFPLYRFIGLIMYLVPKYFSDTLYVYLANRRKSFSRKKNCLIPNAELREKFILK